MDAEAAVGACVGRPTAPRDSCLPDPCDPPPCRSISNAAPIVVPTASMLATNKTVLRCLRDFIVSPLFLFVLCTTSTNARRTTNVFTAPCGGVTRRDFATRFVAFQHD
jgi:hypothetical protein